MSHLKYIVLVAMMILGLSVSAQAQVPGQEGAPPATVDGQMPVEATDPALEIPNYNPRDYVPLSALSSDGNSVQVTDEVLFQSLIFTPEEINTVVATLNRRARTSPSNSANVGTGFVGGELVVPEDEDSQEPVVRPYYPPIATKRIISVSGMIYRSPNDWIVWLNGHKLVPGARLPELVDIKVERERVHLKWFDIGMGKILTITLRPRQTYDITSGVLLNTTGGEIQ